MGSTKNLSNEIAINYPNRPSNR